MDFLIEAQLWWGSLDNAVKLLLILGPLFWLLQTIAAEIIKRLPHKWLAGSFCTVVISVVLSFVVFHFYEIPKPQPQDKRLYVHIQTRSGKVTELAARMRRELSNAGYPTTDYGKVFDLTKVTSNMVLTSPENTHAADRVIQQLRGLPIDSLVTSTRPDLKPDEVHIFLNNQ